MCFWTECSNSTTRQRPNLPSALVGFQMVREIVVPSCATVTLSAIYSGIVSIYWNRHALSVVGVDRSPSVRSRTVLCADVEATCVNSGVTYDLATAQTRSVRQATVVVAPVQHRATGPQVGRPTRVFVCLFVSNANRLARKKQQQKILAARVLSTITFDINVTIDMSTCPAVTVRLFGCRVLRPL